MIIPLGKQASCLKCSLFSGPGFDPLGQARGPAPPLEDKNEDTWVIFLFEYLNYYDLKRAGV